jgi:hypothetical protein
MSFASSLSAYHSTYIKRFYNRKLAGVGAVIGAWCGLSYVSEYYGKRSWNWMIDSIEDSTKKEIKIEKKKSSEFDKVNVEFIILSNSDLQKHKYKNVFSLVIIPRAPFGVNMFTTMSTGSVLGYIGMVYFPFTIVGAIIYNLVTYNDTY